MNLEMMEARFSSSKQAKVFTSLFISHLVKLVLSSLLVNSKISELIISKLIFYLLIAVANPNSSVYVLFSHDVGFFNKTALPVIDALLSYKNLQFAYFSLADMTKASLLKFWYSKNEILKYDKFIPQKSDLVKLLLLWRFSGTYFDLDVVVKKPVNGIGSNFACISKNGLISSAILNLDSKLSKTVAEKSFKSFLNESLQADTENAVLSTVLEKMCNTTNLVEMTRENCDGFKVLPAEDCFAIDSPSWGMFFHENYAQDVEEATKDSFAIRFWDKLSHNTSLSTRSRAPYIRIAEKFCPNVLRASGNSF